MLDPMALMIASEFGSTGELETSAFQRLSLENERNPFKVEFCPVLITLQAPLLWLGAAGGVVTKLTPGLLDPPCEAVMVAVPAATPVAKPALMLASLLLEEVHVALAVRFCVLLSL